VTGPSRRQRVTLVSLVLASLLLVTLDYKLDGGSVVGNVRSGAASVFGPVQRGVSALVSPIGNTASDVWNSFGAADRAKKLRRENAQLRSELQAAKLDHKRADELSRMDMLASKGPYKVVRGKVVAIGPQAGLEWTATIDLGRRDGIKANMTVINAAGLVGRIKTVGEYTATVLLIADPNCTVGTRMARTDQLGLVHGNGLAPMRYELLDTQASLKAGDQLVTGPYGETTYAPGIPVGTVTKVTGTRGALVRTAEVTPFAKLTSLDLVAVVVEQPRTDPRDSVLPTPSRSPSPSTSPSPNPSQSGQPSSSSNQANSSPSRGR
jgi:rod shape-determining protein MreC